MRMPPSSIRISLQTCPEEDHKQKLKEIRRIFNSARNLHISRAQRVWHEEVHRPILQAAAHRLSSPAQDGKFKIISAQVFVSHMPWLAVRLADTPSKRSASFRTANPIRKPLETKVDCIVVLRHEALTPELRDAVHKIKTTSRLNSTHHVNADGRTISSSRYKYAKGSSRCPRMRSTFGVLS